MYISRVIIENFQSHERTEIELSKGLTVLVGESDRGKSAVIRALRWLFFNEPRGTGFIRSGTTGARVTAVMDDGTAITRERTSSKNRYMIKMPGEEKKVYEKIGSEIPEEISALHGVAPVKLDDDLYVALHISTQLEGPFLLSSPGSLKAKAIGRLHSVHIIDAAARDVHQEISSLQREDVRLEERIKDLDTKLEEYSDLEELEKVLEKSKYKTGQLEKKEKEINDLRTLKENLTRVQEKIENITRTREKVAHIEENLHKFYELQDKTGKYKLFCNLKNRYSNVLENLNRVKEALNRTSASLTGFKMYDQLEDKNERYRRIRRLFELFQSARKEIDTLKAVQEKLAGIEKGKNSYEKTVNEHEKLKKVKKLARDLSWVRENINKCQDILINVENIPGAGEKYERLREKKELINRLYPLQQSIKRVEKNKLKTEKVLKRLEKIPGQVEKTDKYIRRAQKIKELSDYRSRLKDTRQRIQKGKIFLAEKEREQDELVDQYKSLLKSLGRCPACFNRVDEHTLDMIIYQLKERGVNKGEQ